MSDAPAPIPYAKPKRRPSVTLERRSTEYLEGLHYLVEPVSHKIPHTQISRDLWGFADLLAVRRDEVLAVQVTSRPNIAARVRKIAESPKVDFVREAGIRVEVHGWDLATGVQGTAGWRLKVVDVS